MTTDTVTMWSPAAKLSNGTTQVPFTNSAITGKPSTVTTTELAFTSAGNSKVTLILPSTTNSPIALGATVKLAFATVNTVSLDLMSYTESPKIAVTVYSPALRPSIDKVTTLPSWIKSSPS